MSAARIAPGRTFDRLIVWVRRELRLRENFPLFAAAADAREVIPLFIVDDELLSAAPAPKLKVMLDGVRELRLSLRCIGGDLLIRRGPAERVLGKLLEETGAAGVYVASSLEPSSRQHDLRVGAAVTGMGRLWREFKQHTILGEAVTKADGEAYTVFSAYRNAWLSREESIPPELPPLRRLATPSLAPGEIPTLERLGVPMPAPSVPAGGEREALRQLSAFAGDGLLRYHAQRDSLGVAGGTSRLSHHLATGSLAAQTVYWKVREAVRSDRAAVRQSLAAFLGELIWREFYCQILLNYPHVVDGAFHRDFDALQWDRSTERFEAWKAGATGVPIVDAAMRQLACEGWMHNRARMVVASFLSKDLHCDWRLGERHFWRSLADADCAANNGGWQWSAGTGNDAQPWFRIFHPVLQSKRFDPHGIYIRRHVPELSRVPDRFIHEPHRMPSAVQAAAGCIIGRHYPGPIVDHDRERREALLRYGEVRANRRRQTSTRSLQ